MNLLHHLADYVKSAERATLALASAVFVVAVVMLLVVHHEQRDAEASAGSQPNQSRSSTIAQAGGLTLWIEARRVANDRTELAVRPDNGQQIRPTKRFFPGNVPAGVWHTTSKVQVNGVTIGQIHVQRLRNGRLELGLKPADNGGRILPSNRFFSADPTRGQWKKLGPVVFHALTTSAVPSGSDSGYVDVQKGIFVRPGLKWFPARRSATIIANTNDGYHFVRWVGDASGSVAKQTIVVDRNKFVTAQWVKDTFADTIRSPEWTNRPDGKCVPWSEGTATENQENRRSNDRQSIVRVLFGFTDNDAVARCAKYAYHDYGPNSSVHQNGHAGWDVKTTNANGAHVMFFSLTAGRVIEPPPLPSANPIAIDDGERVVIYYHASHRYVTVGNNVVVGQPLGIQGCAGPCTGAHVHIEVQRQPAAGGVAQDCSYNRCHRAEITYDPIAYLAAYLSARNLFTQH